MPLESAFRHSYSLCFHPPHKHARRFSVGLSTDILGSLSSIMFSSVLWAILLESSAPSTKACTQHSGVISLLVSVGAPYFPLKVKLKRYARKKRPCLQFKTHFSFRQKIYWWLSIVRCWQIPHIFHIRPLKLGAASRLEAHHRQRLCLTLGAQAEMNQISILFCAKIFSPV